MAVHKKFKRFIIKLITIINYIFFLIFNRLVYVLLVNSFSYLQFNILSTISYKISNHNLIFFGGKNVDLYSTNFDNL